MKNLIQDGKKIKISGSATGEQLTKVGSIYCIPLNDIASDDNGIAYVEGVFEYDCAAIEISQGAKVYYNTTNDLVTTTSTDNDAIGYAFVTSAASSEKVTFKLVNALALA